VYDVYVSASCIWSLLSYPSWAPELLLSQADLFGLHNPETDCLTLRAEFDESVADQTSDGLRRLG